MSKSRPKWRKSSASGGTNCVEVSFVNGSVLVRDSKDEGSGPTLSFTVEEWRAFLEGVHAQEFGAS
jgi:hypothetical protein